MLSTGKQDPPEHTSQRPMTYEVFLSGSQEGTPYPSLYERQVLFSLIAGGSFGRGGHLSHIHALRQFPAEYLRGILCRALGFSLCRVFSSLVFCPMNSSHLHLPRFPAPSPQLRVCRAPLGFLVLVPWWANSLKAVSWGYRARLACFLSLRDHCPLLTNAWCLKNHCFLYFSRLFYCFIILSSREVNLDLVPPSWHLGWKWGSLRFSCFYSFRMEFQNSGLWKPDYSMTMMKVMPNYPKAGLFQSQFGHIWHLQYRCSPCYQDYSLGSCGEEITKSRVIRASDLVMTWILSISSFLGWAHPCPASGWSSCPTGCVVSRRLLMGWDPQITSVLILTQFLTHQ